MVNSKAENEIAAAGVRRNDWFGGPNYLLFTIHYLPLKIGLRLLT